MKQSNSAAVLLLNHVLLFVTLRTVARQPPMELSRQACWSGVPFPTPGDLSHSGIEPASLVSPALAGRFFKVVIKSSPNGPHLLFKSQDLSFSPSFLPCLFPISIIFIHVLDIIILSKSLL